MDRSRNRVWDQRCTLPNTRAIDGERHALSEFILSFGNICIIHTCIIMFSADQSLWSNEHQAVVFLKRPGLVAPQLCESLSGLGLSRANALRGRRCVLDMTRIVQRVRHLVDGEKCPRRVLQVSTRSTSSRSSSQHSFRPQLRFLLFSGWPFHAAKLSGP